jgi:DNA-binding NarL/FixJ family response regulator
VIAPRLTVVAHPLPLFRAGIMAACERVGICDPVIGASSLAEVATAVAPHTPGGPITDALCVCSADLDDVVFSGIATLRARRPGLRVIVIVTAQTARVDVTAALAAGVTGVLEASVSGEDLASAITAARTGRITLAPGVSSVVGDTPGSIIDLTRRERQVLELMGRGLGNRAIAAELFISENTVRNHVRRVHEKLDVRTRTEAVVRAARVGLLDLTEEPSAHPG